MTTSSPVRRMRMSTIGANGAPKTLRRELVLLHLPPKRYCADMKRFGSLFPVALVTLESLSNEITFLRLELQSVSHPTTPLPRGDLGRQLADGDPRSAREDHRTLDGVLELSDVSGPVVVDQRSLRLSRNSCDVLLYAMSRSRHEFVNQCRDVVSAFP